tara:strand:- start:1013 stop:1615 length:603 start_codon:yes stop_codon:yes gene_type:complete
MGCLASIYSKTTTDVITELKQLDMSLREMVYKYDIQLEKINNELKIKVAEKAPKDRLMVLLRQRKILRNYLTQCENRMTVCTQKQCSLEQLEITKMQLDAIKSTSKIFKRFTNRHTVEKVEQLQESMCALQDDMMDISDILNQPTLDDLDVEDELEELMALVGTDTVPDTMDTTGTEFPVSDTEFPVSDTESDERVLLAI